MHKRIFLRYFNVCALIIFLTVFTLGAVTSAVFTYRNIREQNRNMEKAANKIASMLEDVPANYSFFVGTVMKGSIETVKETIDCDVLIINRSGTLVQSTLQNGTTVALPKEAVDTVLSGKNYHRQRVFIREHGNAYTVGAPIFSENRTVGGVFVTARQVRIGSEFGGMIRYLMEKFCLGVFVLIELICQIFGLSWRRKEQRQSYPYQRDTMFKTVQDAEIREYRFSSPETDSYGAFLRRLARIETADAKIGYAYRTLCRIYNGDSGNLKKSDTPREVENKITSVHQLSADEGREVREIIEKVKFADRIPGEAEKQQLLGEICRIISGYLL